jgi:hypothetical protein
VPLSLSYNRSGLCDSLDDREQSGRWPRLDLMNRRSASDEHVYASSARRCGRARSAPMAQKSTTLGNQATPASAVDVELYRIRAVLALNERERVERVGRCPD